jgi:diguanylate cyclase (GGDEF)-like protein
MADGLPQNFVKRVIQTRDGYLWLATQEGLVQYDGFDFRTLDQFNTRAIVDPEIYALLEDEAGSLWFATRGGLLRRGDDGAVQRFRVADGLPGDQVTSLVKGREGEIWIGTRSGVGRYHRGAFEVMPYAVKGAPLAVSAMGISPEGVLWVGTDDGLFRIENEVAVPKLRGGAKVGRGVSSVLAERGQVWVGTKGKGLHRYSKGHWKTFSAESGLGDDRVQDVYRDRQGALWISTAYAGLVRYFEGAFTRITVEEGLETNSVECVMEDREGSLWVGTGSGGLNRLRDGRFTTLTRRDGLVDDVVWAVFQSRDGAMWVGTEQGVTRHLHGRTRLYSEETGLSDNFINSFAEDSQGRVWVGTDRGVNIIGSDVERVLTRADGLPGNDVRSMVPDPAGGMWLGIMRGGLAHFHQGRIRRWGVEQGLASSEVRSLFRDGEGGIWVGTNAGLSYLRDGKITSYGEKEGFSNSRVFAMHAGAGGAMWFGTDRGLYHFASGVFSRISVWEGLFNNKVYTLLNDGLGYFWMSSNKGVHRVRVQDALDVVAGKKEKVSSEHFGIVDGMRSVECNVSGSNSGVRGGDGTLWFATIAGVAMIDPRGEFRRSPPSPALGKVVADGKTLGALQEWTFEPGLESIRLHYVAPTFVVPEGIRFKYRLIGASDEWVFAESVRIAQYAHLWPGDYTFEVKSISRDGVESAESATFRFRLEPYFYQTGLFYGGSLLLAGLLLFGWHRGRVARLERQERYLAELVRKRTEELEVANQKLQELSTTDPLTGLRNRRYLVDYIETELAYSQRQYFSAPGDEGEEVDPNRDIVFVLVDLDHFKAVNDTHGHAAGDQVLVQAATILRGACREVDRVVRWGGEEFLLVAPKSSRESSHTLAQRVVDAFRAHAFEIGEESPLKVTCSVGFACYPLTGGGKEGVGWEDVVGVADEALYAAKKSGRDMWVGLLGNYFDSHQELIRRLGDGVGTMVASGELSVLSSAEDVDQLRWET